MILDVTMHGHVHLCVWNLCNRAEVTYEHITLLTTICCYVLLLQVAVVPEKVVNLTHRQVGRRSYRVIARVQRKRAALSVKLLQIAVLLVCQGLE